MYKLANQSIQYKFSIAPCKYTTSFFCIYNSKTQQEENERNNGKINNILANEK